jgi:pilus assembly protein CpaC
MTARPSLLGFGAVVAAGLAAAGVAAQTAPTTDQKAPATEQAAPAMDQGGPAMGQTAPAAEQTAPAMGQTAPATEYTLNAPAGSARTSSRTAAPERMDVKVTLHKTETIKLATSFTEALVGDATVADIVPLTDRSIYIVGKKIGVTRLTLLDRTKEPSGVVDIEVTYDLAALKRQLKDLSGVKVRSVNGKILLTGMSPDALAMQQALLLAEQIAPGDVTNAITVAAPQQVLLEVRFLEADRSATRALGVNTSLSGDRVVGVTGLESTSGSVISDAHGNLVNNLVNNLSGGLAVNATPFGAMIGRVLMGGASADIVIKALEDRGVARRLAEPNLVALSGDTASFLAGGEFPFPVSAENDKITVDFKKFGVGLAFTPTVLSNGQINLKIEPEVSELDPTNFIRVSASVEIPSLIVRRASTTIELRDGQSFAVAGLLQGSNIRNTRQLPWIGDVPVIGTLLRSAAWQKRETDLVIIVTPRLIKPKVPGEKLATPLDSQVSSNDREFFLGGLAEVPVKPAPSWTGHIIDWPADRPFAATYVELKK